MVSTKANQFLLRAWIFPVLCQWDRWLFTTVERECYLLFQSMKNFFLQKKFFRRTGTDPATSPCSLPLPQKGTWGEFRMEKNRKLSVLGCWPWIVKMWVSGVISVSPGSCIFSYIEKSFLINLTGLLLVISSTLLMFDYMSPHHHSNKTLLYILAPPITLQSSTSELSGRLSPRLQSSVRYLNET